MPKVSVLIPVFNNEKYLKRAVDSILCQTYSDFELIIIDDGSSDSSFQILSMYSDARLKIYSRANRGMVATRNELIALSSGDLVAIMDADDISHPRRIAAQVEFLEANPDVGAVGTRGRFIDPDGDDLADFNDCLTHDQITQALMATALGIINPSSMIRRAVLADVGSYRSEFTYSDDLDMWLRIGEKYELRNIDEVLLSYRVHEQNASHLKSREQSQAAWRAVAEACIRRGIATPKNIFSETTVETSAEKKIKWAWWAYNAGNLRAAFKHTVAVTRRNPFDLKNWKLLVAILTKSIRIKR